MEMVKQWTLSVCMACIVAGILQQFSASHAKFSVIKLVLTLYILVTAFAPLGALRYPETRMTVPAVAQMAPLDTDALVLAAAQKSLADTVAAACVAGGSPVAQVQLQLNASGGTVSVAGITITPSENTDMEKAKQLALAALGADVPVTLQREG